MIWVLLSILAFILGVGGTFQACRCCIRDLSSGDKADTWGTMIGFGSLILGGAIIMLIDYFLHVT